MTLATEFLFDMTKEDAIEFMKILNPIMNLKQRCSMKKLIFQTELTFIKHASKECMLCHYWYFKDVIFKFQPRVCNKCSIGCIISKSNRIETLNVKGVDYRCILCVLAEIKLLIF